MGVHKHRGNAASSIPEGNIIEITLGIRCFVICRRWDFALAHGKASSDHLQDAAGAGRTTGDTFNRHDRNSIGGFTKNVLDAFGFLNIHINVAGSVGGNIADFLRRQVRIRQRFLHGPFHPVAFAAHLDIRTGAITRQLGIGSASARHGMLEVLQDNKTCALGENASLPITIEGAAGFLWDVIQCAATPGFEHAFEGVAGH